jgi:hypothetical protein
MWLAGDRQGVADAQIDAILVMKFEQKQSSEICG